MTPIVATLIVDNREWRESLSRTAEGMQGIRHYKVNTDIAELAIDAIGLPQPGEKWSSKFPTLFVTRNGGVERLGGRDALGDGSAGWSRIPVEYSTPSGRGSIAPSGPGDSWTEIQVGTESEQIKAVLAGDTDSIDRTMPPINDGQGLSVSVGVFGIRVRTFQRPGDPIDMQRLTDLCEVSKINLNPVTLPPLYKTGTRLQLAKGQIRYISPEFNVIGDLMEVTHNMIIARRAGTVRWSEMDTSGRPTGRVLEGRVLMYRDFTGLW